MNSGNVLTIFVIIVALAFVAQAAILGAFYVFARKAFDSLKQDVDEIRDATLPILTTSREFFQRISPRIDPITADVAKTLANTKTITSDIAEVTGRLRDEAASVQSSATEVLNKVKHQTERLDHMVTEVLNSVDRIGHVLETTVTVPARQAAGVLAAFKAVVESLRRPRPVGASVAGSNNDHEHFV